MKIYTGFGDTGQTALYGGQKVAKNHIRLQVYGTLDEMNSSIGLLRSKQTDRKIDAYLQSVQELIFIVSSEIASPDIKKLETKISDREVKLLEKEIDLLSAHLPPLKKFILPGGTEAASLAHVTRTICRRSERYLAELMQKEEIRSVIPVYINRLGDFFFVLARYLNMTHRVKDVQWSVE